MINFNLPWQSNFNPNNNLVDFWKNFKQPIMWEYTNLKQNEVNIYYEKYFERLYESTKIIGEGKEIPTAIIEAPWNTWNEMLLLLINDNTKNFDSSNQINDKIEYEF